MLSPKIINKGSTTLYHDIHSYDGNNHETKEKFISKE